MSIGRYKNSDKKIRTKVVKEVLSMRKIGVLLIGAIFFVCIAMLISKYCLADNYNPSTSTYSEMYYITPIIGPIASRGKVRERSACELLKQVIKILDNPIRESILKALPRGSSKTFAELKAETKLSTGSLHYQLELLREAGYIDKTDSRPARWFRTREFDELIELAKEELLRISNDPEESTKPESDTVSSVEVETAASVL